MSKLKLGTITFTVNGFTLNNGLPYFQKAVPPALRKRIGKATIKIRLHGDGGKLALQCHRHQSSFTALFRAMQDDSSIVPSEAKLAALAMLNLVGLKQGNGLEEMRFTRDDGLVEIANPAYEVLHDFLVDGDFTPSPVTSAAFAALNNKLPVLLSEAFSVYLDNHPRGKDKEFAADQKQHWLKLINLLGDKAVVGVTREDARSYRDHRLMSGVAPTTVTREINVIRAVFTKAIRELSLGIPNQFAGIEIQSGNKNANDRVPYNKDEIGQLVSEALMVGDELRTIVVVLAFTGARLAEVVGLRKSDFNESMGFIAIRAHASRSLKTEDSKRDIPLTTVALQALSQQALRAQGDFLFPRYINTERNTATSASNALNKWARKYVPEKSLHCFRHSLRDLLREVSCPESIAKEIGGWSTNHDISVQYGKGHPLALKLDWLNKAYASIINT